MHVRGTKEELSISSLLLLFVFYYESTIILLASPRGLLLLLINALGFSFPLWNRWQQIKPKLLPN